MDLSTARKALDKAKIALMSKSDTVFFTTLCFSMVHEITEEVDTAATNGECIKYNPSFLMSLTDEERVFLMVHEAMHVALLHLIRRGDRDPEKWNMAADYVINLMLVDRGFKMPKDGLLDRLFAGMDTVQVYDLLPNNPPFGCPMLDIQAPGEQSPEEVQQAEQRIQDIVVRAALQSKMAGDKPGTIPGDIQIYLDKLLNPILPWDKLLRRFMMDLAKTDYSWRKPNRRYMPEYHLPTLYGEKLGHIAIAVDTSGSVSDKDFHRFVSEINGVLKKLKPSQISLIQFDTMIKSIDVVKTERQLGQVNFHGRGGTRINQVIEWAAKEKPLVLVVFSDGEFHHYHTNPKCPVLWMIHGNKKFTAPYGKVIHYEV